MALRSAALLAVPLTLLAVMATGEREAKACGGCFHPPTQVASDITDERMLLSVSTTQTTLYDQIRYTGNPSSFAWVLPIHGTVDVGLSADVLFDSIDAVTATQIQAPAYPCPPPPFCGGGSSSGGFSGGSADAGAAAPPVVVTKQENVGPYATVQLHPTSTSDPGALTTWLSDNGFTIPADVVPILQQYTSEGFDFLAMKLLPNQGIQAMRPVRVTSPGASLSLPLRMAAVGTGASVGITIWVVADGRYEPQNFPAYHIADSDLVWDWTSNASNYTTLRAQHEANLGGKGWELESSITLNQQLITGVIQSGGIYYPNGGFGGGAPPANASDDYLPVPADGNTAAKSADDVRNDDIAKLFAGMQGPNVRVTRMRSDISHAAMTTDFVLKASDDQSELSNVHVVTQSTNVVCPSYPPCPTGEDGTSGSTSSGANPRGPFGISTSSSGSSSHGGGVGSTSGDGTNSDSENVTWGGGCEATAKPANDLLLAMVGGLAFVVASARRRRK